MTPKKTILDIHSHILPGMDDGSRSIKESIKMARAYTAAGVTHVFATPHHLTGTAWAQPASEIREQVNDLQSIFNKNDIPLFLLPGMEIALHSHLIKELKSNQLLPLGSSDCYLLEPPFQLFRDDLLDIVLSFKNSGKCVILAHPERIPFFQKKTDLLFELVKQGVMLQINIGSLLGKFGKKALSTAMNLANHECIHFVASDSHGSEKRTPPSHNEWRQLEKVLGNSMAKAVSGENALRLLI